MPRTKSKKMRVEKQGRTAKRTRSGKTEYWEATRYDYNQEKYNYLDDDEEEW